MTIHERSLKIVLCFKRFTLQAQNAWRLPFPVPTLSFFFLLSLPKYLHKTHTPSLVQIQANPVHSLLASTWPYYTEEQLHLHEKNTP